MRILRHHDSLIEGFAQLLAVCRVKGLVVVAATLAATAEGIVYAKSAYRRRRRGGAHARVWRVGGGARRELSRGWAPRRRSPPMRNAPFLVGTRLHLPVVCGGESSRENGVAVF